MVNYDSTSIVRPQRCNNTKIDVYHPSSIIRSSNSKLLRSATDYFCKKITEPALRSTIRSNASIHLYFAWIILPVEVWFVVETIPQRYNQRAPLTDFLGWFLSPTCEKSFWFR